MAEQRMRDLPRDAQFIGLDRRTRYQVTTPASEHADGWVEVRDISMTGLEAEQLRAAGGVAPGQDPRAGFFMDGQVEALVEVI